MATGNPEVDAIVAEVMAKAELALIETLNEAASTAFERSQEQVPKSQAHEARPNDPSYPAEPLEAQGRLEEAVPGNPVATIIYEGPYAAAQEAGQMTYESRHGKPVEWEAQNYTTPGTGAHYVEDSIKSVAEGIEAELALRSKAVFGDIFAVRL